MKIRKLNSLRIIVVAVAVLSLAGGIACADNTKPMKPEVAAKKESVRQQREQRVTDDQRKTAATSLKAERLKVYKAKQLVKKSKPEKIETK